MFEKHLWKSGILSNDFTLPQLFFKHLATKNQLPGFYISETLGENWLIIDLASKETEKTELLLFHYTWKYQVSYLIFNNHFDVSYSYVSYYFGEFAKNFKNLLQD